MKFKNLIVNINIQTTLNVINIMINYTLLVFYNDKLKFIVVVTQKREIHSQRFNFNLNVKIKSDTFLRILNKILRISYTSLQVQE